MNLKLTAAMAALSLALVPAAFAQEQEEVSGFYIGGGAGQFNASIDDVDDLDETVQGWDDDDTAYKFFAGYRLNRFLAFELDYINLGEPSGEVVPGRNVDAAVDGFAPYVVGTLPLGQYFEVYGRLGYYFYDATRGVQDEFDNRVQFDEESEDLVYGAGIGANIGEKFNIRAEYEKFDLAGLDDADALWLTAAWRF
ncbi:MAG TPA: porin family protein [Steroidobacteraceae bacterium]|nr:porin family protein [Steroidobacteraceae bacterium]